MSPIGVGKFCCWPLIVFLNRCFHESAIYYNKPFCTCLGIGLIITNYASTGSAYLLVVAVSQALAGGTLIYVAVFEILERERSKNVPGLVQVAFVVLGFCVMMLVEFFGKVFIVIIFWTLYLLICIAKFILKIVQFFFTIY